MLADLCVKSAVAAHGELSIPDISAPHFARVLEYLYTASISPNLRFVRDIRVEEHSSRAPRLQQRGWEQTALDFAAVYLLGGRFALPALQALVVQRLAKLEVLLPTPGVWDVARVVYGQDVMVLDCFRAWFVGVAQRRFERGWGVNVADLEALIGAGGMMAVDLWRAVARMDKVKANL